MTRQQIIRNFIGLALVLFLGVGGVLRFSTVLNPACRGGTMGTSYSVKISGKIKKSALSNLTKKIETELAAISLQMSTWEPTSEISKFNASEEAGPFPLSDAFALVVLRALKLSESTHGAFDPTLNPLLNLWGFGSDAEEQAVPSDTDIATIRAKTGWEKIRFDTSSNLWKSIPEIQLDLNAIAKGYGVDAIARLLTEEGYQNWFVEIGGEVVVRGHNPDGVPWRIGIQFPTTNPMDTRLQGILNLTHGATATSGDYRNYLIEEGVTYSHIIDPRSGHAVRSDTASVTVVATRCMDADGMATALFVMGATDGLAWVEEQAGVEAMFLLREANGEISEKFSSGFVAATSYISKNQTQ